MQAEGKLHAQKFINRDDFLTFFCSKIKQFENKSIYWKESVIIEFRGLEKGNCNI